MNTRADLIAATSVVLSVLEHHGTINNRDDRVHALRHAMANAQVDFAEALNLVADEIEYRGVNGQGEIVSLLRLRAAEFSGQAKVPA